jgi:hypothetical protein
VFRTNLVAATRGRGPCLLICPYRVSRICVPIKLTMQLGIHRKSVGILNTTGYYDNMLAQLRRGIEVRPCSLLRAAAVPHKLHPTAFPHPR